MRTLLLAIVMTVVRVAPLLAQPTAAPTIVTPGPPAMPPAPPGPTSEEAKADFQRPTEALDPSPSWALGSRWRVGVYGHAELDVQRDSTLSFDDLANNASIQRPHTVAGDEPQSGFTPARSRLGLKLGTHGPQSVQWLFLGELGAVPGAFEPPRLGPFPLRHLFVGMQSPVLDVLLGRSYDVFGWGGRGFHPNTVASLGVPGQLYDLRPQLRLSKLVRSRRVDFEVAAASVAPVPGSAAELQLGLRLAVNGWTGASAQGAGPPVAAPLQIGVSSVGRRYDVPGFSSTPTPGRVVNAGGLAINAFVPVAPADGDDLGNSLALTIELSSGSGIADLYPRLDGGARFPGLPNPMSLDPAPIFVVPVRPADVTFDGDGVPHTINWRAAVVGFQYHLPFARGRRVWISGTVARTTSNNLASLSPRANWSVVWTEGRYADANVFVAVTPALQVALSSQLTRQTYADGVSATNARSEVALSYFF